MLNDKMHTNSVMSLQRKKSQNVKILIHRNVLTPEQSALSLVLPAGVGAGGVDPSSDPPTPLVPPHSPPLFLHKFSFNGARIWIFKGQTTSMVRCIIFAFLIQFLVYSAQQKQRRRELDNIFFNIIFS